MGHVDPHSTGDPHDGNNQTDYRQVTSQARCCAHTRRHQDEAEVEHASAKDLIAQILGSSPSDDLYDAKVKVLGEYIDHRVKEEETEMFPKVRKTELDLKSLGESLAQRTEELMGEAQTAPAH